MALFKKKLPRTRFTDPQHDYAENTFFENICERLKYHDGILNKERIYINLTGRTEYIDGRRHFCYHRLDRWTEKKASELREDGYERVINMPGYDSLVWWGVPIYLKLDGFEQFDIHVKDEKGNFIYSQDTSATLHDEMVSTATRDFLKGLFKTTLPAMDLQKLGMIAILGVGAFFGLMMMGII